MPGIYRGRYCYFIVNKVFIDGQSGEENKE